MHRAWFAAAGNLTGWLLAAGLWLVAGLGYFAVQVSRQPRPSIAYLDASFTQVIRPEVPAQEIAGGMSEPGDAADDYHQAVLEYIGTQRYRSVEALAHPQDLTDPDQIPLRAPEYVLAGAKKSQMNYTLRFVQPEDWTSGRPYHLAAFEAIGGVCALKADLLIKAGRSAEAEALLKAMIAFGCHIEQERLRLPAVLTGLGLQKLAAKRLFRLYDQSGQAGKAEAVKRYLDALQRVQGRLIEKARLTVARLERDSPPTAELIWLTKHDRDRMWRIEAALALGLAKWAAPSSADRAAARARLRAMANDPDPAIQAAAKAALAIAPEDLRNIR